MHYRGNCCTTMGTYCLANSTVIVAPILIASVIIVDPTIVIHWSLLDTPGPIPSQVKPFRSQKDLKCPRWVFHPRVRPLLGTKPPSEHP